MEFLRIAEEGEVCKRCREWGILDTVQVRIARRSRLIADFLIRPDGTFSKERGEELLKTLTFPITGYFDELFFFHVQKVVQFFIESRDGALRLRQLSFPLANPWIETLVRLSLLYPAGKVLEKRDISVAVVASLLTFLRQTVGSCFATAPIILAQSERIGFLFEDLYNLMTRGFLKRVIEGEEVRVPISTKTGPAEAPNPHAVEALPFYEKELFKAHTQSPILKCYEYTVAGFTDWKIDFYKWNMYASLGLSHEEVGGIGEAIYTALNLELEKVNQEIEELYKEIFQTENQIRMNEALLQRAYREEDIRRYRVEIEIKAHQMTLLQEDYHKKGEETKFLSEFFKYMIERSILFFPSYFQEVYDPEMGDGRGELLQDRPSGFRLLFKHGRIDPSLWTMIYTKEEYIKGLIEFYQAIEIPLMTACEWEKGKDLVRRLVDVIIERIQGDAFLEGAFKRVAALHERSGGGLSSRTPWSYLSGGSLESLIKCYFSLKNEPESYVVKPETPLDLLIGLIEFMKDLPYERSSFFEKERGGIFILLNETHACTFRPGLDKEFVKAWGVNQNSFTYVRDLFVKPALQMGKGGALVFGDSNWRSDLLGFIVDSQTGKVQIARVSLQDDALIPLWHNLFPSKEWKIFLL